MRKTFYYLVFILFPFRLVAQPPTIHNMENYKIGNRASFGDIGTPPASGPSGPSQTWDFSSVSLADTLKMEIVTPSATIYHATYEERFSDSVIEYIFNSSGSAIVATVDSSSIGAGQVTTHPAALINGITPATYGNHFMGILSTLNTSGSFTISGKGSQDFRADGYGTLKTPAGTFSNVLRIREVMMEQDTIAGVGITVFDTTVSYLWYDDSHPSPLMRIDSVSITQEHDPSVTNFKIQTAKCLLSFSTETPDVLSNTDLNLKACLSGNKLVINGGMEPGKQYELNMVNTAGQLVFKTSFSAQSEVCDFILPDLAAGMYFANVRESGHPTNKGFVKLVKP